MSAVLKTQEPSARYLEAVRPPLMEHFDLVASAPGGVARLRELILILAVRGQLVAQDPSDEPASRLLSRARAEKQWLFERGKGARSRSVEPISAEEQPFELPIGWIWARLPEICYDFGQQAPTSDFTYIDVGSIDNERACITDAVQVLQAQEAPSRARKLVEQGTVVYSTVRPYLRNIAIVERAYTPRAIVSTAFAVMHPHAGVDGKYLLFYLRSEVFTQFVASKMVGVAYPAINDTNFFQGVIALPPAAEQARIVARVEELMRLCDALEATGRLEDAQHAQLLDTLLGTLTDSASPEELAANWQRVAAHFDLLLDRPEAVDALEQTILKLAVRGLLAHQNANDEPATKLLGKGDVLRKRRAASGQVKRNNSGRSIPTSEVPFGLPAGWAWSVLPDLCAITGGSTPSKAVPGNWAGDIPWVSPKDMKVPAIRDAQDHVSDGALAGSLSLIPPGSLLMVVRGMILAHSFPVAETLVPVTINQDMKALTPFDPELLPFLMLVCSGMKAEILQLVDRSTHGTCKLESSRIFGLPIPVPPLAEQHRIVARVAQLRRLCADLREKLARGQTTQERLADALTERAIGS